MMGLDCYMEEIRFLDHRRLLMIAILLAEDSRYYTRPGKEYWPNWIL